MWLKESVYSIMIQKKLYRALFYVYNDSHSSVSFTSKVAKNIKSLFSNCSRGNFCF